MTQKKITLNTAGANIQDIKKRTKIVLIFEPLLQE